MSNQLELNEADMEYYVDVVNGLMEELEATQGEKDFLQNLSQNLQIRLTSVESDLAGNLTSSHLHPNVSQLNPNLSQLNPNLSQLNPNLHPKPVTT